MGALNTIAKGALGQFGREFGRAAANSILNGHNSQKIEMSDRYTGRLKPTDSLVIRAIKNIQTTDFVIQDKANASRLIDITDEFININKFKGVETLAELEDFYILADIYNDKYAHGSALISDEFKEKVMDHLALKREELVSSMRQFNDNCKNFVIEQRSFFEQKKVVKSTLILWSFPIWGLFGLHHFYLNKTGKAIGHLLFCWTLILPLMNFFEFLRIIVSNDSNFDKRYNPELVYLRRFDVSG